MSQGFKQKCIEKGYEHFAEDGPENLSINKISKEIGYSRASFYHHFGDIDIFIHELLDMHWQIIQQFNLTGKKECKNFYPDLYVLLAQNPIPLKFSKQLFINRNNPIYNYLFSKAYNESSKIFVLKLFSKQFSLKNNEETFNLWVTVGESWYSRLDTNDLSAEKMQQIAKDVMNSVLKFVSSDLYSKIQEGL
ncbi:MAG: TetR/AcrR family transcriptional regulator [Bacteroidetes bacterium]|nr:TetR/AcrR family transcriptional regulator [Bacteroidota bacterium]